MQAQIKLMISSVFRVLCFKPRGPPLIPHHPKKQSICKTPLGNIKFRMHRSQDRTRSQTRTRYSRIAGPGGGVAGSPPPLRIMQPLNRNLSRQADQQEVFFKSCPVFYCLKKSVNSVSALTRSGRHHGSFPPT